jgi:glycosyltransferase involved in cell wall biosynthesis
MYNDAGIVCRYLDKLTEQLTPQDRAAYKLVIYLDQVYQLQRPEFLARMDKDAAAFITFTSYWKQVLEEQGIKKSIGVLRHGFDQSQFQILNKQAMRKKHNIPEQVFLILNINRNTPRKRYDIVVTAFAELVARHPAKPLALLAICDGGESGGFPIQEIYMRELSRLKLPAQFHAHKLMISRESQSYSDTMINELYSLSDIGVSAAEGEGFGLCNFEAMGVGIPQVVPNVGGFKDFCIHNKNCQLIEPKWRNYLPLSHSSVGGVSELIDPHDLSIGMEDYLMDSELRTTHGQAARETVLKYSWAEEVTNLTTFLNSL